MILLNIYSKKKKNKINFRERSLCIQVGNRERELIFQHMRMYYYNKVALTI